MYPFFIWHEYFYVFFFTVPYPYSIDLVHSRTASLFLGYHQQRRKHRIRHLQCLKYNDVIVHQVIELGDHDSSIEYIPKSALKYIIVMIRFFERMHGKSKNTSQFYDQRCYHCSTTKNRYR